METTIYLKQQPEERTIANNLTWIWITALDLCTAVARTVVPHIMLNHTVRLVV